MPYIEESDLLNLHSQIEKEQKTNNRLLDQIKIKNGELNNSHAAKTWAFVVAFVIIILAIGYIILFPSNDVLASSPGDQANIKAYQDSIIILKNKVADCKVRITQIADTNETTAETHQTKQSTNQSFKTTQEVVAKILAGKEIWTVQIGAFKNLNLQMFSDSFINFKLEKQRDLFKYSLGNFATKSEAQKFQRVLKKLNLNTVVVKYN